MFKPSGQGGRSLSPPHHPITQKPKREVRLSRGVWAQGNRGSAGRSLGQQPSPGPLGPRPTSGSRCGCVIISAPLASVDYAACLLHLQQYPESSISSEFL